MIIGLWTARRTVVAMACTASLFVLSCGDDGGEEPDDVQFASLDNLVEVTGCVRVEGDSGYFNYSDSGWGWDSGYSGYSDSGWGSGGWSDTDGSGDSGGSGSTEDSGSAGSTEDSGSTGSTEDSGSSGGSGVDDDSGYYAGEDSGEPRASAAPPKSRPCRPSERIDEVQTASCSDASSLKGGLLLAFWSLPFLVGRRRNT